MEEKTKKPLAKAREKLRASTIWRDFQLFLKETWYLLRKNWATVLPFLFVYSIVNMAVTYLAVNLALDTGMALEGFTYIDSENLLPFLATRGSVILAILLCVVVCFLHVVEIGGVMHAYSMSSIGEKSTFEGMMLAGITSGARGISPDNWAVFPFIMVLVPLTGFFTLSFSSLHAAIPGFIADFIAANTLYRTLYRLLYVLMLLMEVAYIFAMNFYLLEKSTFADSCRKSRRLIAGKYLQTLLFLAALSCIINTIVVVFSASVSALTVQALSLFSSGLSTTDALRLASWSRVISQFIGLTIAPAVNIAALTTLFFRYVEDRNMLATLSPDSFRDRKLGKWQYRALNAAIVLAIIGVLAVVLPDFAAGKGDLPRPEIAAHRGDSVNAPENSMPAFELAILENADWIELDVHQTKDGVIVVSHDDDLARISGNKVHVYDLTYDEIQEMDVGSWFSDDFAGLRLATLDDALKLCKDKIKVQIEIKPTDHDVNIEESILKIINENGMHDQVLVLSLKPEPLRRIKELDPTLITAYCMVVAWKHVEDIPFADYYTVEEGNITTELVNNVHASGGQIFAWTVNSDESVQHLVDCGVDAILTDDPVMMRRALDSAKYTGGPARYLRIYLDALRAF